MSGEEQGKKSWSEYIEEKREKRYAEREKTGRVEREKKRVREKEWKYGNVKRSKKGRTRRAARIYNLCVYHVVSRKSNLSR